jgi:ABC-type multidrug transport system ATPase subunit
MTLLLRPPNSGKSTFLKMLAGRVLSSKSLTVSGDVRYNGKPRSEFVLERTAAYIDQEDNHVRLLMGSSALAAATLCGCAPSQCMH